MTREQNVFWAKRNIVDYIWKSLHLEGLKTTYPSTDSIFNKYVPAGTDASEVIIINNDNTTNVKLSGTKGFAISYA